MAFALPFIGAWITSSVWGWIAGTVLMSLLNRPKVNIAGPTLSDLKVQQSGYGLTVPIVLGRGRLAGRVIDKSDLKPVTTTTTKRSGSMGPKVTTSSTAYYVDLWVALHDARFGPLVDVVEIYANGELIYSSIDNFVPTVGTPALSGWMAAIFRQLIDKVNARQGLKANRLQVYSGADGQLPDPAFERLHGVGNVPGYEGLGGFVLEGFEVTRWGGVPNLEAYVIASVDATYQGPRRIWGNNVDQLPYYWCQWNTNNAGPTFLGPWIRVFDGSRLVVAELADAAPSGTPFVGDVRSAVRRIIFDLNGNLLHFEPIQNGDLIHAAKYQAPVAGIFLWAMTTYDSQYVVRFVTSSDYGSGDGFGAFMVPVGNLDGWSLAATYPLTLPNIARYTSGPYIGFPIQGSIRGVIPCVDGIHFIILFQDQPNIGTANGKYRLFRYQTGGGLPYEVVKDGDAIDIFPNPSDFRFLACAGQCVSFMTGGFYQVGMMESDVEHVWVLDYGGTGGSHLYQLDPADNTFKPLTDPAGMVNPVRGAAGYVRSAASIWADKGMCFGIGGNGNISFYTRIATADGDTMTVGEAIEKICVGAGLPLSKIDASALTDTFDGISIG